MVNTDPLEGRPGRAGHLCKSLSMPRAKFPAPELELWVSQNVWQTSTDGAGCGGNNQSYCGWTKSVRTTLNP